MRSGVTISRGGKGTESEGKRGILLAVPPLSPRKVPAAMRGVSQERVLAQFLAKEVRPLQKRTQHIS